jgi:hypothetical protein
MQVIKAPEPFDINTFEPVVFLAGSIEMGAAINWQEEFIPKLLSNYEGFILNPRRDDWDASWVQRKDNPQFNEQVNWELRGLHKANVVFFYFAPNTISPISLLELGLVAQHKKIFCQKGDVIVYCPDDFQRKGNVDITLEFLKLNPACDDLDDALYELHERVRHHHGNLPKHQKELPKHIRS